MIDIDRRSMLEYARETAEGDFTITADHNNEINCSSDMTHVFRWMVNDIARMEREVAEAKERVAEVEADLSNGYIEYGMAEAAKQGIHCLTTDQINAAWAEANEGDEYDHHHPLLILDTLGIVACEKCGGTKEVKEWIGDDGEKWDHRECDCRNNGWIIKEDK